MGAYGESDGAIEVGRGTLLSLAVTSLAVFSVEGLIGWERQPASKSRATQIGALAIIQGISAIRRE